MVYLFHHHLLDGLLHVLDLLTFVALHQHDLQRGQQQRQLREEATLGDSEEDGKLMTAQPRPG